MYNIWMSILLRDGVNPTIKGMLCNNEGDPLLFDTQLNALNFWMAHKGKFQVEEKYIENLRGTPQVVREGHPNDVLYNLLDKGERVAVKAIPEFILYSDAESGTQIMGDQTATV